MVANFKNNFLLVPIVVLLLLVVSSYARFSTKVTKDDISDICIQNIIVELNASFCFEFFKSVPETAPMNYSSLAKFVIIDDYQKASDMHKQFQLLESNTTDHALKRSYGVCSYTLDLAVGSFNTALKNLASKDYVSFRYKIEHTVDMTSTCREELSSFKPNPKLLKEISIIENISYIIMVIRDRFLCKGIPDC